MTQACYKSNTKLKSVKAKLKEKIVAMRDWVEEMGKEALDGWQEKFTNWKNMLGDQ